ncbi:hypothetical protein SLEP1_g1133 [Rubroshorea leprosula]|uniref:adenylate dimethylallyltransferase (ADP/ATP-dependent) n=1 Tax=Rubroshorea leprosula TaxID=152421 RepID=A0AAV5HCV7_9ROSI|nr:hypothetical protein SLEP1_g1133 [Rubroshorea leprosula]
MGISMLVSQQPQLLPATMNIPPGRLNLDNFIPWRPKKKVVVVMGATGTGKSRLSIDLASLFPAEIINSDKMQVHEGLDIVTNKITEEERKRVPHHLLGIVGPNADFTASDFCDRASIAMEKILSRGRLPVIAGGSNSYIEALIDDVDYQFRSKYDPCFLCVDVRTPVLHQYVSERVDRMVKKGMIDEARKFFSVNGDYKQGIRKAIGVPEYDMYFRLEPFLDEESRAMLLKKAIQEIKNNNCKLVHRQLEKIHRLRNVKKWNIHRLDATEVFNRKGNEADEAWEELVAGPSMEIVAQFLDRDATIKRNWRHGRFFGRQKIMLHNAL